VSAEAQENSWSEALKPLTSVGKILIIVLFAIVAAIWLTLATQVMRVRRVCRGVQEPTISST
jgi:hypothetical protein